MAVAGFFVYLLVEEWLLQTLKQQLDTFVFGLFTDALPHKVCNQTHVMWWADRTRVVPHIPKNWIKVDLKSKLHKWCKKPFYLNTLIFQVSFFQTKQILKPLHAAVPGPTTLSCLPLLNWQRTKQNKHWQHWVDGWFGTSCNTTLSHKRCTLFSYTRKLTQECWDMLPPCGQEWYLCIDWNNPVG